MKILKYRGMSLKDCLRISQEEFKTYVVRILKEMLVFIHSFSNGLN